MTVTAEESAELGPLLQRAATVVHERPQLEVAAFAAAARERR